MSLQKVTLLFGGYGSEPQIDKRTRQILRDEDGLAKLWRVNNKRRIVHQPSHCDYVPCVVDGKAYDCLNNPLLQNLSKPGTIIVPVFDHREMFLKTVEQSVKIEKGEMLFMDGSVEHFGKTKLYDKEHFYWNPVVHAHLSSKLHPHIPGKLMYTTGVDTYMPLEHIEFMSSKAMKSIAKQIFPWLLSLMANSTPEVDRVCRKFLPNLEAYYRSIGMQPKLSSSVATANLKSPPQSTVETLPGKAGADAAPAAKDKKGARMPTPNTSKPPIEELVMARSTSATHKDTTTSGNEEKNTKERDQGKVPKEVRKAEEEVKEEEEEDQGRQEEAHAIQQEQQEDKEGKDKEKEGENKEDEEKAEEATEGKDIAKEEVPQRRTMSGRSIKAAKRYSDSAYTDYGDKKQGTKKAKSKGGKSLEKGKKRKRGT